MIVLWKVLRRNPAHIVVGVYSGPARDRLAYNGELVFRTLDWSAVKASVRQGGVVIREEA